MHFKISYIILFYLYFANNIHFSILQKMNP